MSGFVPTDLCLSFPLGRGGGCLEGANPRTPAGEYFWWCWKPQTAPDTLEGLLVAVGVP